LASTAKSYLDVAGLPGKGLLENGFPVYPLNPKVVDFPMQALRGKE
jgi:hypothetical protein